MAETLRFAMADFNATLDPKDVLRRMRASVERALGADNSQLAVRDGDKLVLRGAATMHASTPFWRMGIRIRGDVRVDTGIAAYDMPTRPRRVHYG
jgi:hypothetical protein